MNSKIEARIEAVRLAVNVEGVTPENIVSTSESIYGFILSDSELPETYDANANIKELMAKAFPIQTANPLQNEEADTETGEKA